MVHKKLSLQAAVDETVKMIDESYNIINRAERRLPKLEGKAKEDLYTYILQCKDQATGSVYFQYVSTSINILLPFQGTK